MISAPISVIYISLAAVIFVALGIKGAGMRAKTGVMIGDGGNRDMTVAMRAQANANEYVPMALLLLLLELNGGASWILHLTGIVLIVARIWHAIAFTTRPEKPFGRAGSTTATWIVIVALAISNIVYLAI